MTEGDIVALIVILIVVALLAPVFYFASWSKPGRAVVSDLEAERDIKGRLRTVGLWLVGVPSAIFAFGWYAENATVKTPVDPKPALQALYDCQQAIKRLSKDPEKADVPYVANQGISSEYTFVWSSNTSLIRMRNGLGVDVPARASCTVNASSMAIINLTLNGETII